MDGMNADNTENIQGQQEGVQTAGGTLLASEKGSASSGGNADTVGEGKTEENSGNVQGPDNQKGAEGQNTLAAPEKYDYEIPDTWDENYKQQVESIAKEHNLTNEQMKAFALHAKKEHERFMQVRQENMDKWAKELKQDPDFAGENFQTSVQYALKGLAHVDPKGELLQVLEQSGYGSHPAVVRAMYKIGKMLDNDSIVNGSAKSAAQKPLWDRLYQQY